MSLHVKWIASYLGFPMSLSCSHWTQPNVFIMSEARLCNNILFSSSVFQFVLSFFAGIRSFRKIVSNILCQLNWQKPQNWVRNSVKIGFISLRWIQFFVLQQVISNDFVCKCISTESIWLQEMNIYVLATLIKLFPSHILHSTDPNYQMVYCIVYYIA